MTTITLGKHYIEVKGHSGYAEHGKDIVCAAISTLVEATYNYLIAIDNVVKKIEDEGLFIIKENTEPGMNRIDYYGEKIFKKFESMVNELAIQYPNHIQIFKLL